MGNTLGTFWGHLIQFLEALWGVLVVHFMSGIQGWEKFTDTQGKELVIVGAGTVIQAFLFLTSILTFLQPCFGQTQPAPLGNQKMEHSQSDTQNKSH